VNATAKHKKQERARRLADAAERLVGTGRPEGNLMVDGHLMRLQTFRRKDLEIEYLCPVQDDGPEATLTVRFAGSTVLKVSFDGPRMGHARYEPGEWERALRVSNG
jgi:hypothetical protein